MSKETIDFQNLLGQKCRLMVVHESPAGDYGGLETDEHDADDGDLIAALCSLPVERRKAALSHMAALTARETPASDTCTCHSCEVLPILHQQVAELCEFLGAKRDEVPCDSWTLINRVTELKLRHDRLEDALAWLPVGWTLEPVFDEDQHVEAWVAQWVDRDASETFACTHSAVSEAVFGLATELEWEPPTP